ncbi:aldo/keto reductase [Xiamenia xianingshaonis]|uniref:Aldo/keto reductase n=1 Tax=Xiamenia xianingshaonis TaxID=2682776 RepID=A0A9E6MQS6_9ACTN|nr:aldo/keto reductase [Xiamenia xianingshaonis]NHM13354.1 aldo/keto reductase [Xiamenia xianingshaonis]QTU84566.1 aldo/keto reductase [Xiamenia xianingshaonis]
MQFRTDPTDGNKLSALGFGCMRLPTTAGKIDLAATEKLLRLAVDRGVNYLDTAYIYRGSEQALGEVFARNPDLRERVNLATKLPTPRCEAADDFDRYLQASQTRLGTDRIDYYLIHNLTSAQSWRRLASLGIEAWIARQKAAGRIVRIGFSYHGPEADFPVLLDAYDWDFCQIQYNYLNEHYQAGTAGLVAAAERGLPVFVMEPLLGGKLAAELPVDAQAILADAGIPADPVRLALRWVWDHPEVTMVLSGMNAPSQVSENADTACEALPNALTSAERQAVELARASIAESYKVPCTGCGYCMPCPKGVNIPSCFAAYNASFAHGWYQGMQQYVTASGAMVGDAHFASDCVQCGACVSKCPQHIDIPGSLASVKRRLQVPGLPAFIRLGTRLISR